MFTETEENIVSEVNCPQTKGSYYTSASNIKLLTLETYLNPITGINDFSTLDCSKHLPRRSCEVAMEEVQG